MMIICSCKVRCLFQIFVWDLLPLVFFHFFPMKFGIFQKTKKWKKRKKNGKTLEYPIRHLFFHLGYSLVSIASWLFTAGRASKPFMLCESTCNPIFQSRIRDLCPNIHEYYKFLYRRGRSSLTEMIICLQIWSKIVDSNMNDFGGLVRWNKWKPTLHCISLNWKCIIMLGSKINLFIFERVNKVSLFSYKFRNSR